MYSQPLFRASLVIMVAAFVALPAPAQDRAGGAEDQPRSSSDDQEREQRRRRWRERMERMDNATPQERREMRIDRQVAMLTRTYDLTEQQQAMVQAEVERMSKEYQQSLGSDAEGMDRLRQEMRNFWRERIRNRQDDRPNRWRSLMDDPKFAELRDRMRAMREKYSFDWQASIEQIEKLLPEKQVAAGRERRLQWLSRWGQRRARRSPSQVEPQAFLSVDSWDEYTRNFIEKYGLDSAQIATARAILKDVKERAVTVRRTQEDVRQELDLMADGQEKVKRMQVLDEPIKALFAELKARLDRLVTERQRRQARDS